MLLRESGDLMNILMANSVFNARAEGILAQSPFTFLLVSRFNIYLPAYTSDWSEQDLVDWSVRRLSIFKEICLPSVINQSERKFHWLILCDSMQSDIATALEEVVKKISFAHIVRCDRNPDPVAEIKKRVINFCSDLNLSPDSLVCTARLDCDDGINREYVNNINIYARSYFSNENAETPVCFSYCYGTQLKDDVFYALSYPHNPFISLIERFSPSMETVYAANHGFIDKLAPVSIMHTRQPMWIQVVHGRNVMNQLYNDVQPLSLTAESKKKMFGIAAKNS